ncbi:MAG: hypothetical protein OSJ45_15645 [Lachnospiraceae bacterium]|nr:hypothetical protein [Lachnospiraceae bacterium]
MSKDSYMEKYSDFVEEVAQNASDYTEKDWEKKDGNYQKYSDKWYKKFHNEFTASDKLLLTAYKVKYSYYRELSKCGDYVNDIINSIDLDSSVSTIKSLKEELINGAAQIDNEIGELDESLDGLFEKIVIELK